MQAAPLRSYHNLTKPFVMERLCYLPYLLVSVICAKKRADERTRTAETCSLRLSCSTAQCRAQTFFLSPRQLYLPVPYLPVPSSVSQARKRSSSGFVFRALRALTRACELLPEGML